MPNYNVRFDIADVRYIAFEKFCKKHNIEFSIQPLLQQYNVSGALPSEKRHCFECNTPLGKEELFCGDCRRQ